MSTTPTPAYVPRRYRRSVIGPLVLIAIGVLFLLGNMGVISYHAFALWFSRYWPVLLILWGVIRLLEYYWARNKGYPTPRLGAGSIVFLVFFIMFGMAATRAGRVNWDEFGNNIGWDSDGDWGIFGTRYEFTDNSAQPLQGGAQVKVISARGDVTVKPSADNQAHLFLHKYVRTGSQDNANAMNNSTHPKFQQQGSVWVLDMSGGDFERGRFDLDLELPSSMPLSLSTHHGDLHVLNREANVDAATDHGDISLEQIKGDAVVRLNNGNVTAKNVSGNVSLDGTMSDVSISDVGGVVSLSGNYWGNMQLARLAKQFHLSTSRTDLQFAKLDGDFEMQPDDLRANAVTGPFRLDTRSKTVHLEDVSGSIHIDDKNATVELRPKSPLDAIDVSTVRGEIDLQVPPNAGFQLDAASVGGEIQSDFGVNSDDSHTATARTVIGKGGPMVRLRADHGSIQIRKQ